MTQLANDSDLKYADINLCPVPRQLRHPAATLEGRDSELPDRWNTGVPGELGSDGFFPDHEPVSRAADSAASAGRRSATACIAICTCGSGGDPASWRLLPGVGQTAARRTAWRPSSAATRPTHRAWSSRTIRPGSSGSAATRSPQRESLSDTVWGLALPEIWLQLGRRPDQGFYRPGAVDFRTATSRDTRMHWGFSEPGRLGVSALRRLRRTPMASASWWGRCLMDISGRVSRSMQT